MVRRSSGRNYTPRPKRRGDEHRSRLMPLLVFLFCLLLFWDVAGPLGVWKYHRLCQRRDAMIAENIRKAKENSALAKEIARLKSDRSYQERVVRQKLGWIKEGELLYRFIPSHR